MNLHVKASFMAVESCPRDFITLGPSQPRLGLPGRAGDPLRLSRSGMIGYVSLRYGTVHYVIVLHNTLR
jgi:hypothetical protein